MKPTMTLPLIAASAAGQSREFIGDRPRRELDKFFGVSGKMVEGVGSAMLLQILGILVVAALAITLFVRPGATVAIVLAVGVVLAAIVVSWNDVEQYRAQRAANAMLQHENSSAAVTVPPPNPAHAGS
jgi:4-hydroxybenzoate polyprenyltransferase